MSTKEVTLFIPILPSEMLNFTTQISLNSLNTLMVVGNPDSYNSSLQVEKVCGAPPVLSDKLNNNSLVADNSSSKPHISKGKSIAELVTNGSLSSARSDFQPSERGLKDNLNFNIWQKTTISSMTEENNAETHQLPVSDKKIYTKTTKDENTTNFLDGAIGHIIGSTNFQELDNIFSDTLSNSIDNKAIDASNDDSQDTPVVLSSICPGQSLLRSNIFATNKPARTSCLPAQVTLAPNSLFASPNSLKSNFINEYKDFLKSSEVVSKSKLPICKPKHIEIRHHNERMPNLLKNFAPSVHHNVSSGRFYNSNSGNLKSNKHIQQVNSVLNSEMDTTKNADDEDNDPGINSQCSDGSSCKDKPIFVSEEATRDLELLKKYFVNNKCLICGFVSKRSHEGWLHMIVHMTVKPHQCKTCAKSFATKSRLIQHNLCHSSNLSKFSCSTCGKYFKRLSYLKDHERQHVNVVRYKCEICQKGFARMVNLRRHARSHTGEKPFTCEICGDSFASSSSRKQHVNVHTKEVAYDCGVCDKSFYSAEYFRVHMKAHEQGNVFQCDFCDAKFNFKSNLNQHKSTHSQDRSHKCDECGKAFKLPHHLRQHLDTHKSKVESSRKYKRTLKRVQCDINDESINALNEGYIVPDLPNIDCFPEIRECFD